MGFLLSRITTFRHPKTSLSRKTCRSTVVAAIFFLPLVHSFSLLGPKSSFCRHILPLSIAPRKMASANNDQVETIRVLAVHGSGGSGSNFQGRLDNWVKLLRLENNVNFQIDTVDAPFPKGDGYCWWNMPPNVRSFNATEYQGFEESAQRLLHQMQNEKMPDLVIGHSQGAILLSALLALNRISAHPRLGYILVGVAWPNPFSSQLESLQIQDKDDDATTSVPRVLFVTGMNDKMNPPSTQTRVRQSFERAGMDVSLLEHPAGHNVPMEIDDTLRSIASWIRQ